MSEIHATGKVVIQSDHHAVEYDLDDQLGGCTLYFKVKGKDRVVPVFIREIDDAIALLQRGKAAIEALEPESVKK